MALILAIESDRRQVNYLTAMVRGKLHAELVLGETAEGALSRLGDRVPDLILTSALLSPKDEQALGDRLRRLNGVAAHVQMLTLPVFAPPSRHGSTARGGMLSALLGDRVQSPAPDGCDPAVFAEQCKEYLRRSAEDRDARRHDDPHGAGSTEVAGVANQDSATTVDIDLSGMLDDGEARSQPAAVADEDEPAVYELSADAMDVDGAMTLDAALGVPDRSVTAATEATTPTAEPEPAEDEFDDWQKVVDALKRESAQVRVPRERKPDPRAMQTAPAVPAVSTAAAAPVAKTAPAAPVTQTSRAATAEAHPATAPAPSPKIAAEPPRRRLRAAADEWGVFDPTQAGMAALYERLEQLSRDEERH